ncbi:MAG TPA: GNAT family N-acetyltransferase [Bryobacteraceae bacterium]|jgi:GNAT superfamily N-acetyltransferase
MLCSDLALSQRLERAEAHACAQFAEARRRIYPASGAEWIECAGAYAVFDGVDSPITQTFGLGVFEPVTADVLNIIERFFHDRAAPVFHEVSPLAGVDALNLLCERHYVPVELSSVLYQPIPEPSKTENGITVRVASPDEADLFTSISTAAWGHEHPELHTFLGETAALWTARADSACFLAALDGEPGAAGSLCIHNGVALFAGAATIPAMRRRGLQSALIDERLRYAHEHGCDLAMMVAAAGSESQRNAERRGFRIAYTRTKWRLNK